MTPTEKLMKALEEWRETPQAKHGRSTAHTLAQGGGGDLENHNLREAYDRYLLSNEKDAI